MNSYGESQSVFQTNASGNMMLPCRRSKVMWRKKTVFRRMLELLSDYRFRVRHDYSPLADKAGSIAQKGPGSRRPASLGQVGVGASAQLDYFLFADHSDGAL